MITPGEFRHSSENLSCGEKCRLTFVLAEKHGLSFYDAVYLELAKRHSAPLAMLDKALARVVDAEGLPLIADTTL